MPRDDGFTYPGAYQADIYSVREAFAAADETIDLGIPCSTISLSVETADLHVNWSNDGAATTSHAKIPAGGSFTYQGPPIQTFRIIGGGNGHVNVVAY